MSYNSTFVPEQFERALQASIGRLTSEQLDRCTLRNDRLRLAEERTDRLRAEVGYGPLAEPWIRDRLEAAERS